MTADWLDSEITQTSEDMRREVALDPNADEGLDLTGLEPIIAMLAFKLVVGIVSGFSGKASYDLWKKVRTRKQLEELRARLRFDMATDKLDPVDESTIRHDLIDSLVDQGMTARQAGKVVDGALQRVRTRLQPKSKQEQPDT